MKKFILFFIILTLFCFSLIKVSEVEAQDVCQADLNQDGVVNQLDLRMLLSSWFSSGQLDFNSDSKVNGLEFGELILSWGQNCSPSPTPSPIPTASPSPSSLPNLVWTDQFTSQNSRWEWSYHTGTGYHSLINLINTEDNSAVEIGVTQNSNSSTYSDCSLHENNYTHTYGILEMKLRCTDDNGTISGGISGKGTRGWGFWHVETEQLNRLNVAWFWSASSESNPLLQGFQAMVVENGTFHLLKPVAIDMKEWHIYRVELSPSGTKFFVDNQEVASTPHRPATSQRIEIWIDNMGLNLSGSSIQKSNLNLDRDQKMYIDWVKFYNLP